jgi:hypothetical protein
MNARDYLFKVPSADDTRWGVDVDDLSSQVLEANVQLATKKSVNCAKPLN